MNKTKTLGIKVSERQQSWIKQQAKDKGLTVSTYLFNIIFENYKEEEKDVKNSA